MQEHGNIEGFDKKSYILSKNVENLYARSRTSSLFYLTCFLFSSIGDNFFFDQLAFSISVASIFLIVGTLRFFHKPPRNRTDTGITRDKDKLAKWVKIHWTFIHTCSISWGCAFVYVYFDGAYPDAGLLMVLCTLAISSVCANQLSIFKVHSQLSSSFYFIPSVIYIFIADHGQIPFGLATSTFVIYLVISAAQRHNEYMRFITTELALIKSQTELKVQTLTDELTRLGNRRGYNRSVESCFAIAQRSKSNLSLILIDLDNFKAINDSHGHKEGDRCLQHVAAILKSCAKRSSDIISRIGGEEFAIICPESDTGQAYVLAETIHAALNDNPYLFDGERILEGRCLLITGSIGISSFDPTLDKTHESMFKRADDYVYEAKNNGRNCICRGNADEVDA